MCTECYLGIKEDVNHLVMHCPAYVDIKREMYGVLESIDDHYVKVALDDQQGIFNTLMGQQPIGMPFESAFNIRCVSSHYIPIMYRMAVKNRL